jgi:antitoxin PrlF
MDVTARLTSKGQVTIPKAVRDSLDLNEGDQILFRVEGNRAIVSKTADFLAMAGTVPVPPELRGVPWEEILRRSRKARAESRR